MYNWDELMRFAWDISETPYQRRSRQLSKYIQAKLNISNVRVSRSSIGNKYYYNVKIIGNLHPMAIENIFGDIPTGLVEYVSETKKHIYLIDEDRLHDKYIKNGDLVFKEPFCLFDLDFKQKYDILCPIRRQLEDNRIQVNKIDIWDDYLMLVCNGTDYGEVGEILNIDNNMVNVVAGVPNMYMIKRWDK